jgi:hypothetical protein
MMKIRRALFVLLMWAGFALAAFGQSTTVSGTVTDVSSQTWNNGTYAFQFVPNPQYPASTYTWTGGAFNQNAQITGSLNGSGAYSVSIPSNANISPINSQWKVTFCPQATATCYTTTGVTIFGGTQTLNATPPSITVTAQSNVLPIAYADTEITGAIAGSAYYNVTLASVRVCSALPCSSNWTSSGGGTATNGTGGTVNPAEPLTAISVANVCPASNTGQCFNTPGNTQEAVDCSWTGSTVTCAGSHFVAGDVGKRVMGWSTCNAESANLASNAAATALVNGGVGARAMTISSYISGTQVGVSFAADQTASGNTHCLVWGTPDDTAFAAADTYAQALGYCPKIELKNGYYWLNSPHFYTQPTSCTQLGTVYQGSAANTVYAAGYDWEGQGTGNTVLFLANDFGSAGCSNGLTALACWVRTLNGRWSQFQMTGGQNGIGLAGTHKLIEAEGPGSIDNFTCTNFGGANTTNVGISVSNWDRWYQVNNSGCGGIAIEGNTASTGLTLVIYKYRAENNPVGLLNLSSGSVTCIDCGFLNSEFAANATGLIQNTHGGTIELEDSQVLNVGAIATFTAYSANTTTGSTLYLKNTSLGTSAGTAQSGINCAVACNVYFQNSNLGYNGTGKAYTDVTGSNLYDQGGNTIGGSLFTVANVSISGAVHGSASVSTTALATGNVAITACGSSTAGTFLGSSTAGQYTITFAGTPVTTCTSTITFPVSFLQAPICRVVSNGGNNPAFPANITLGTVSATSLAFTENFAAAWTAGDTTIVNYECTNP